MRAEGEVEVMDLVTLRRFGERWIDDIGGRKPYERL